MRISCRLSLLLAALMVLPAPAAASWYFTWSCRSPIGTSSGREGPYARNDACESALSQARIACTAHGRTSFSGSCSGSDDEQSLRSWGGSGTSSTPGSSGPGVDPGIDWQEIQRQQEEARKRREEEERKRRLLQETQEEIQRRGDAARKASEAEQQATLKQLKGAGGGTELQIKSGTAFFGTGGNPDTTLKTLGPAAHASGPWKQLHCAAYISRFAVQAAKEAEPDEADYLAKLGAAVLDGAPSGVECPEAPAPREAAGVPDVGPSGPVRGFYNLVLQATQREAVRLQRADKQIRKATAERQRLAGEIEKYEQEVARLRAQPRPAAPPAAATPARPPAAPLPGGLLPAPPAAAEPADTADPALAAALAALKAAQDANAQVDALIQAAEREKGEAMSRLNQYEQALNQAEADPSRTAQLTKALPK